jgi:hypothetical protein
LISQLPIDFENFLFNTQKKAKNSQQIMPGVRDSPLLNYTDLFTHRKFMSGENASAYDQNSFA